MAWGSDFKRDSINATWHAPYAAASGAAVGAWIALPVPLLLLVPVVAIAVWRRGGASIFCAFLCLTGFFSTNASEGLTLEGLTSSDAESSAAHTSSNGQQVDVEQINGQQVDGWVTLLSDPQSLNASTRVVARYQGKRWQLQAYGSVKVHFNELLAGEQIHISGDMSSTSSAWNRSRHIIGVINVTSVNDYADASPLADFANSVRRVLERGARSLPPDIKALFSGMVYGDDREQSDLLADDFRAAGLGHLLVVSGQNVAFVLVLVSPIATRFRPGVSLLLLICLLGFFAMVTRFEPSVLRAVGMASVAVISAALGRPEVGKRTLIWAVAIVLMIDPFLIKSLAFQLSVCATSGLLWITPTLCEIIPGPRVLRVALAATAGAQLAVTPLLIKVFGVLPLVALPANILAGPASGPTMMWGLTAGFIAGLCGEPVASLIHIPTTVMLSWVRFIATESASAPQWMLQPVGASIACAGVALLLVAYHIKKRKHKTWDGFNMLNSEPPLDLNDTPLSFDDTLSLDDISTNLDDISANLQDMSAIRRAIRRGLQRAGDLRLTLGSVPLAALGCIFLVAVAVHSFIGVKVLPSGVSTVKGASVYQIKGTVTVLLHNAEQPQKLLESLRIAGVRNVDLIVAAQGGARNARSVLALLERYNADRGNHLVKVVAPPMHRVPHAYAVTAGSTIVMRPARDKNPTVPLEMEAQYVRVVVLDDTPALKIQVEELNANGDVLAVW